MSDAILDPKTDNSKLQASVAYLPGSQKSLSWAPEIIMLFWEVLQCNKRFRSFIVDTDRAHDFMILVLYYATENKDDISKQGIVRMCVFILQTLSVEATFGARLNTPFQGQETLPLIVRIPNFRGTYADFLITVCLVSHHHFVVMLTRNKSLFTISSREAKANLTLYTLLSSLS